MTAGCPHCGAAGLPSARYCEDCGADFEEPVPVTVVAPPLWEAVSFCDRAYFDRLEANGIEFPSSAVEHTFPLSGDRLTIGRQTSATPEPPELDLSGPHGDPAVSHVHAVLSRDADGTWTVTDSDSTNGTYLNDCDDAIPPGEAVKLHDGDRIHVGAWTTITVRRVPPPE